MNKKKLANFILAGSFLFGCLGVMFDKYNGFNEQIVAHAENTLISTAAKSAFLMEYSTQSVIYEKECNKRLPIASMCKIMTLLLSFEAIDSGRLNINDSISVSENAAAMGGSQVFLEANAKYPVKELIKSIVVCSANDSCMAMAETISGSEEVFVE